MKARKVVLLEPMDTDRLAWDDAARLSDDSTSVVAASCPGGPVAEDSLQSRHNTARAQAAVPHAVLHAFEGGASAVVVNCMRDPGVAEARELTDLPVIALAEAAMCIAGVLGRSFGVIVNEPRGIQVVEEQARLYRRADAFTRARSVDIAVADMATAPDHEIVARIADAARRLVEQDGADVLILGCTAFSPLAGAVSEALAAGGIPDVPLIEPVALGVRLAGLLTDLGYVPSRRAFPDSRAYVEADTLTSVVAPT
jgi:allantoin racemase